ncbi:hypothetical protein SV7mr_24580 [Stieleria bergensis]|uniref:Uncharacterized protein n=1 Tax=Stieleria bergensis TaxID=2528025 RepID=A0A517SUZ1_9BACT|nr:hypothetical protein SV7mr_24580 [Planctomycetes bacterium SV_7m_r]
MNTENSRGSFLKFSIRDLITVATFVGISLALVISRFDVRALKTELKMLSSEPSLKVPFSDPTNTSYAGRFSMTSVGEFYPKNYLFDAKPSVAYELIDSDGTKVYGGAVPIDVKSKIFTLRISPASELDGGLYAVKLIALDGDQELVEQFSVIRITD